MRYKDLISKLAAQSGQPPQAVRDVLFSLPDILITLTEDERVRVPFGSFRMTKRLARSVKIPTSDEIVEVPEEMVVKMRPGDRLRRKVPGQ